MTADMLLITLTAHLTALGVGASYEYPGVIHIPEGGPQGVHPAEPRGVWVIGEDDDTNELRLQLQDGGEVLLSTTVEATASAQDVLDRISRFYSPS